MAMIFSERDNDLTGQKVKHGSKYRLYFHSRELLKFLRDVSRDIFIASLTVYLALLLLDRVKQGFASFFFNLDILLAIVLISGIITIITSSTVKDEHAARPEQTPNPIAFLWLIALGILGMVVIYLATVATGSTLYWSLVIGGALTTMLAMLLLIDWIGDKE